MTQTVTNRPQSVEEDLVLRLWGALHRDGADVTGFLDMLHAVVMAREWTEASFHEFVCRELQTTPDELLKVIGLTHRNEREKQVVPEKIAAVQALRRRVRELLNPAIAEHRRPTEEERLKVDNVNFKATPGGNSPTYALRRLKRDRPDLAEKVLAGELSAHAAAQQAGFRVQQHTIPHKTSGAVRVIVRHFSRDEVQRIAELLLRAVELWEDER